MYSTFSVATKAKTNKQGSENASNPRPKRNHVSVACESCRKNRIKCDNSRPCRNCRQRKITCANVESGDTRALTRQIQHLLGRVEELEGRVQDSDAAASSESPSAQSPSHVGQIHTKANAMLQEQPVGKAGTSGAVETPQAVNRMTLNLSTASFVSRLNLVLAGRFPRRLSAALVVPSGGSLNFQEFALPPEISRTMENYYIRLYWRTTHRTLPVVDEDSFTEHYTSLWSESSSSEVRLPSCLVDIILAISLQHESNCKPQGRPTKPGAEEFHGRGQSQTELMSQALYERCAINISAEYENPCLSTLQCYILLVIYLRGSWSHNAAYQFLGLAIRTANILGLHQKHPANASVGERRIRERLWNILFCLDTQQFLEFGRPFGILEQTHQLNPQGQPLKRSYRQLSDAEVDEEEGSFLGRYFGLIEIAKKVHMVFNSQARNLQGTYDDKFPSASEVLNCFEEDLAQIATLLVSWARKVPPKLRLQRKADTASFATEVDLDLDADTPVWRLRQCLLLELSYHWINIGILRWALDSETGELHKFSFIMEKARSVIKHAFAITSILNQALVETDAIHGWYDSHFIQWDAALTLIGFALAYPHHALVAEVLSMLNTSISIFDALGTRFTRAAADVVKEFTTKFEQIVPGSSGSRGNSIFRSGSQEPGLTMIPLADPSFDILRTKSGDLSNPFIAGSPRDFALPIDFEAVSLANEGTLAEAIHMDDGFPALSMI
ncbi:predicted protein [Uncinocarpus reesii 1704]|uniref:Zn(2)-C6 fungal-type domain-containing protein n=1 Tax=Uncinocarpus reesii (strain UAMH 1704) TaxID=336963 RepID=C4JD66_UNCRE|nr:uncharacterized protein UREG_00271 [Uncinocarpus reesii 1704]EEP75425.1 predicted protein [Uncinocarpus reesii 1704]